MVSGRHLLVVGALACAGLLTVRDSQRQTELGYRVAEMEANLRRVRKAIREERTRLLALQTPDQVMERAGQLGLAVKPTSDLEAYAPRAAPAGR
ncbi:MAG: hypothetical protein M5U26_22235 [Planctomycetota bacterium]|nr:hypothetical protein [Planctomycetota bacterium]